MSKKPAGLDSLRAVAEVKLGKPAAGKQPASPAEELLHELRVHQIELEMQNETLRQSQLELEKSRDRYVDFYDFFPIGYLTLSQAGVIEEVNLTGAMLLGVERARLVRSRFAACVAEEDSSRWRKHFQALMKSDAMLSVEVVLKGPSAAPFYAKLDCLRLAQEGAAPLVRVVLTDISERKHIELALAASRCKLEEKELAKSRFFAAAGHDLRQPLAAANLFIDTLKFAEPTPRQSKILQQLDYSMATFSGLLDNLLNISKLESGTIKPEYTLLNVNRVIQWLDQNFAPLANEKQIGFRLHFPLKAQLFVRSDVGLLESVLMNLVSNAIKFTSKGAILVSARKRGSEVLFQVWDSGVGIADADQERIFAEFYQIDNPQRDRVKGFGLGLAIVRRSIALLGGNISCRSRVGRGSVFEFRLPLDSTLFEKPQHAETLALPQGAIDGSFARGKHFVVVEDDALVAQAMIDLLQGMGGQVQHFDNAEQALQHDQIESADYYIADYTLAGKLNGVQFLNQLRQKSGKLIKAVLLTGETSTAFLRVAADCEWPVLFKPVSTARLVSSLSAQGRRGRLRERLGKNQ